MFYIMPRVIQPVNYLVSEAITGKGFLSQMKWEGATTNTTIYIFDLENHKKGQLSPVQVFEAPPMFLYHHVNAYEEEPLSGSTDVTRVVLDVTGYDRPDMLNGPHGFAYIENMKHRDQREQQVI
jgi:carotenoid cleavage dioxygenase-like enzyme